MCMCVGVGVRVHELWLRALVDLVLHMWVRTTAAAGRFAACLLTHPSPNTQRRPRELPDGEQAPPLRPWG